MILQGLCMSCNCEFDLFYLLGLKNGPYKPHINKYTIPAEMQIKTINTKTVIFRITSAAQIHNPFTRHDFMFLTLTPVGRVTLNTGR